MPRKIDVTVNEKTIKIEEKRVFELEAMFEDMKQELQEVQLGNDMGSALAAAVGFGKDKILAQFPQLTEDDLHNAYPSELEAVVEGFLEVNFSMLRRFSGKLMGLAQFGLAQKALSRK